MPDKRPVSSAPQAYSGESHLVNRNGHHHPQLIECERRVKKLVDHLDEWLHSGFEGTRIDAIKKLGAKVS